MSGELPVTGGSGGPSGLLYLIVGGLGTLAIVLGSRLSGLKQVVTRIIGR